MSLQGRNILEVSKIKMLSPYLIDELLKCGVVLSNNDSKHDLALTTIRIFTKAVCVFLVGQLLYIWSCMSICLSKIVLSIWFLGHYKYSAHPFFYNYYFIPSLPLSLQSVSFLNVRSFGHNSVKNAFNLR